MSLRASHAMNEAVSGGGEATNSLEKLVASKLLGYETKPNGATEHQTNRWLRWPSGLFVA